MKKDLRKIRLIVMDVDGTLTDGSVFIGENVEVCKRFHIKDGLGIRVCIESGIEFMILTGRKSAMVEHRAKELGIQYVYQGISDKETFLKEYMKEHDLKRDELAYFGDDLNDYRAMKLAGFVACPLDAALEIKGCADYVSEKKAGEGAVREILQYLLTERQEWDEAIAHLYGIVKEG